MYKCASQSEENKDKDRQLLRNNIDAHFSHGTKKCTRNMYNGMPKSTDGPPIKTSLFYSCTVPMRSE